MASSSKDGNMVVSESTVTTTPSATAKDINVILLNADTKQQKSAKCTKSTRVPVLSSHDRLEVTRSLQKREKRLLQGIESLIANGDPDKKRDYLEKNCKRLASSWEKRLRRNS